MKARWTRLPLRIALLTVCAVSLMMLGVAFAESTWVDEISNSLTFYKASYPGSNFEPYLQRLNRVKDALGQGDKRTIRVEMGKWFKMLRNREHGINDVAADELFNFAMMVTPIEEYGISVPPPPTAVP